MISLNFDSTRVKIDLDAISSNFDAIAAKVKVPVMAVVKADAYGHGAIQVARLLQDRCAFFGVGSLLEATELRRAGLTNPILILGHTPANAFPTLIREGFVYIAESPLFEITCKDKTWFAYNEQERCRSSNPWRVKKSPFSAPRALVKMTRR